MECVEKKSYNGTAARKQDEGSRRQQKRVHTAVTTAISDTFVETVRKRTMSTNRVVVFYIRI